MRALRALALIALAGCTALTDFDQFEPGTDMGPVEDGSVDAQTLPDFGPCDEERAEECNGFDDDCDEMVDEDFDFTDLLNCGGCGNVCVASSRAEPVCVDEACDIVCDEGYGDCDEDGLSCETALDTASNCGGCGTTCAEGEVCSTAGETPQCVEECPEGEIICGTTCAALETDPNNCGSCGAACPEPTGGEAACVAFACTLGDCDTGFADCNDMPEDGCETMTAFDPFNCGDCDVACSFANGIPACSSGSCALVGCVGGYDDCDTDAMNGCEAQLGTVETCGDCSESCHEVANGTRTCGPSGCEYACNAGFDDCNGDIDSAGGDGCETQLGTNMNCSACGSACPGGQVCSGGACVASCGGSTPDSCPTGCTDLDTDPTNCGGCGTVCTDEPNSSPTCASGSCGFGCDPGYGDCTGAAGCETALNTTTNCGTCGNDCTAAFPNATVACVGGACMQTGCDPGYADCTGAAGCETPITTVDDCGSCGNTCSTANGTPACSSTADGYACTIGSCDDGFAQCDADLDCEPQEATYPDADSDTFGDDLASSILECPGASSRVTNNRDCDDRDDAINPDGVEVLNMADDDCDGAVDEGLVTSEICNRADDDSDGQVDEGLLQVNPAVMVTPFAGVNRLRATRGGGAIGVAFYNGSNISFLAQTNPSQQVMPAPPPDGGIDINGEFDVCWDGFTFDVFFAINGGIAGSSEIRVRRYASDGSFIRETPLESRASGNYGRVRCARHPTEGTIALMYSEPSGTIGRDDLQVIRYSPSSSSIREDGRNTIVSAALVGAAIEGNQGGFLVVYSLNGGNITSRTVSLTGTLGTTRNIDTDTTSENVVDLVRDPRTLRQLLTVYESGGAFAIALADNGNRVSGTSFVQLSENTPTYARDSGDTRFGIVRADDGVVNRFSMPGLGNEAPDEGPYTITSSRRDGDAVGFLTGPERYSHYYFTTTAIFSQTVVCPVSSGTP